MNEEPYSPGRRQRVMAYPVFVASWLLLAELTAQVVGRAPVYGGGFDGWFPVAGVALVVPALYLTTAIVHSARFVHHRLSGAEGGVG